MSEILVIPQKFQAQRYCLAKINRGQKWAQTIDIDPVLWGSMLFLHFKGTQSRILLKYFATCRAENISNDEKNW
jgi:hypothetical protein